MSSSNAAGERSEALRILKRLDRKLAGHETEVEFYFLGEAVIYQAFAAEPGTAQESAMFRSAEVVRQGAREVAEEEGLSESWMHRTVRAALAEGQGRGATSSSDT